jgi:DNA processing protein
MPLAPAALEPLLRVAMIPGIGPARLSALLRRFGSAERVLGASGAEVGALPGFGTELVKRVLSAAEPAARERVRAALEALGKSGAVAITPDDLAYPEAFRALPDPPFLLFAAGRLELLGAPGVGVVGTREPTDYGRQATAALAGDVARAGYAVVSGMAKGIDAAAHGAALDAGGTTVGVLGHGIDRVYPPENRLLFGRVRERGLLISELPPGEEPLAGNFPRRNRLIAALSLGVLVVEMGEKSGAKHTVDYALELGKEVFAVPGPIGSPMSAGTNQLLKDGARLVTSARDILEELRGVGLGDVPAASEVSIPPSIGTSAPPPPAATRLPPPDLAPDEAKVFAALRDEPRHVDELAAETGLAPSNVLAALLGLELKEAAESLPGKQYRRR